jgi:hypothetical protein
VGKTNAALIGVRGVWPIYELNSKLWISGKARRLKQAKEEAQDEIEKYRQERERQFKEFETKVGWVIRKCYSHL